MKEKISHCLICLNLTLDFDLVSSELVMNNPNVFSPTAPYQRNYFIFFANVHYFVPLPGDRFVLKLTSLLTLYLGH